MTVGGGRSAGSVGDRPVGPAGEPGGRAARATRRRSAPDRDGPGPEPARPRRDGAVTGFVSWRTALRIARREARRAKGRTALVVAMIALPVLALTFAAVSYDMFTLTPDETTGRQIGSADALLRWVATGPVRQSPLGDNWTDGSSVSVGGGQRPATVAEVAALLPPGSRVVPATTSGQWLELRTPDGVGGMEIRGLPFGDPIIRGVATLRTGRLPANPGEAVASEAALRRLDIRVGDTFTRADGSRDWTVVGVAEFPDDLGQVLAVPPDGLPDPADSWLVEVPGGVDWGMVKRLNGHGVVAYSRIVARHPPPAGESPFPIGSDSRGALTLGVLVGGLGTLEVVLLAGPAFAVGARRRQRDLALVAAAGGTPAQLRRLVLADGVVLGLAGALVGLAVGMAGAVAGRPLVERYLAHSLAGGYRFFPAALLGIAGLAVLTGMLAAMVPAFVAARQDVVAGLTGRRGVVRSRKRWLLLGLLLAGAGVALALVGAARVITEVVLAGLVVGEVGLVLCTPSLVGLLARIGRLLPLAPRIALRDTARNRAAAAPAISAVMAAVAGSVALGVFLVSDQARTDADYLAGLPAGYLSVFAPDAGGTRAPVDRDAVAAAATGLPVTDVVEIREPACRPGTAAGDTCYLNLVLPAARECPVQPGPRLSAQDRRAARADPRCNQRSQTFYGPTFLNLVDDGRALPVLTGARPDDVAAATATLRAGGVVVTDPQYVQDGTVTVRLSRYPSDRPNQEPQTRTLTAPAYALTSGLAAPREIYSPVCWPGPG
ncbi:ABC transporter permease [Micromonospora zhanjiangensis]